MKFLTGILFAAILAFGMSPVMANAGKGEPTCTPESCIPSGIRKVSGWTSEQYVYRVRFVERNPVTGKEKRWTAGPFFSERQVVNTANRLSDNIPGVKDGSVVAQVLAPGSRWADLYQ